ncbi:MAG: alkaline phosphatase D family protein [Sphingomonadales bacterium]|nr:alkaline phosphatase D family protein [Sphingomonadales bacterium]
MHRTLDRRDLIRIFGLGAVLAASGRLLASPLGASGFTHKVASGEPGPHSMLLWTRFVPGRGDSDVTLIAEMATDASFSHIVAGDQVRTGAYRDWTAKVVVSGLEPGTDYWYRFVAPDGQRSSIGRTKTLPVGDIGRFNLGLFSCSHLSFGWFNAYRHAADRDDLDLWLHVGDYIYEDGDYPLVPGRLVEPIHEAIALADYRLRFACYRSDPDLQALHQRAPMVALWDDHETADDSWEGGARNHQPATEGAWDSRKAASIQAYREWMPVSDEPWRAYHLGTLATLYRTESRLLARTRQLTAADLPQGSDLAAFRDGPWRDPSRTMLGSVQEAWLDRELQANGKTSRWQLLGMATNMGVVRLPLNAIDWLAPNADAAAIAGRKAGVLRSKAGLPSSFDNWGGYPAARSRLLASAQEADADLVVLTGDSHNAWAFSLSEDGRPAGVEFGGHSVTSPGAERSFPVDPAKVAQGFVKASPELNWADTSRRGYVMIEITPDALTGNWLFMRSTAVKNATVADTHRMTVGRGRRSFQPA